MRKQYSAEFKAKVVREAKPLSQVAAAYSVHPNVVTQWRDQALAGLVGVFNHQTEADWAAKCAAHEQEKQEQSTLN